MPDFAIEDTYQGLVAGVDEAGRGPWAGPVAAGAVIFLKRDQINPYLLSHINDSKQLSAKRREEMFDLIQQEASKGTLCYGIGSASACEIDEINILQASFLAMRRAVQNMGVMPDMALIDGNKLPKTFVCPTKYVIKGDLLSFSIAAASIVAKVWRDRWMQEFAVQYPGYGFEKNAGYGTKDHMIGLEKYGITPEHRKTYRPIKELILKKSA